MVNSLEEAMYLTVLDFEYDLNSPILDVLVYNILLHIQMIEMNPESANAFPVIRDYILNKGNKEVFKEIPSKILGQPLDEELRAYATSFCQNEIAKLDAAGSHLKK